MSLTIRAICTPGNVCCSLLKPPTTTTTTTAAAIIIQTPSPIAMCGMPNPLGAMPKILGDATTTTTVFGEFPWMVAILEKTDTGLRHVYIHVYRHFMTFDLDSKFFFLCKIQLNSQEYYIYSSCLRLTMRFLIFLVKHFYSNSNTYVSLIRRQNYVLCTAVRFFFHENEFYIFT